MTGTTGGKTPKRPPVEACGRCGKPHERVKWPGIATCTGHQSDVSEGLQPCLQWRVDGLTVCRRHGASTATARAKAEEHKAAQAAARVAERAREEARTLGIPLPLDELDPKQLLLQLISFSAGHVQYYLGQVQALGAERLIAQTRSVKRTAREGTERGERSDWTETASEAGPEVHLWLTLYNGERDRLARWIVEASRLGIEERTVRVAEAQGTRIADMLRWLHAMITGWCELDQVERTVLHGWMRTGLSCLSSGDAFPNVAETLAALPVRAEVIAGGA